MHLQAEELLEACRWALSDSQSRRSRGYPKDAYPGLSEDVERLLGAAIRKAAK